MASRQPIRSQTSRGTDVQINNNVEAVIGILSTPINSPAPPALTRLFGILVLSPNGTQWDLVSTLPSDVLPNIPASLLVNPNEVEFNYRFQGGF